MKNNDDFNDDLENNMDSDPVINENEKYRNYKKIISLIILLGCFAAGIYYIFTLQPVKKMLSSFSFLAKKKPTENVAKKNLESSAKAEVENSSSENKNSIFLKSTNENEAAANSRPALNLPSWQLSDVYSSLNDEKIAADLQTAEDICKELKLVIVAKINAQQLLALLKKEDRLIEIMVKIFQFREMRLQTDIDSKEVEAFNKKYQNRLYNITYNLYSLEGEITKISNDRLDLMIKQAEGLKLYRPYFHRTKEYFRANNNDANNSWINKVEIANRHSWHQMYVKLFAAKSIGNNSLMDIFSTYKTTVSSSFNVNEREAAVKDLYNALKSVAPQYETILASLIRSEHYDNFAHKYKSIWQRAEINSDIKSEILNNVLENIQKHGPNIYLKYANIKAKILNAKNEDYIDLTTSLALNNNFYTWEEARDLTLNTYNQFSRQLMRSAANFYINPWIEAKAKADHIFKSQMFSLTPQTHPYLLLSYNGDLNSLVNLMQQISNGAHQSMAADKNIHYFDVSAPMLKITSGISIKVLFKNLIAKSQSKAEKISIMLNEVERILKSVLYNARVAYFRAQLLTNVEENDLSKNTVSDLWMEAGVKINGVAYEHERYNWIIDPNVFTFGSLPLYSSLAELIAEIAIKKMDPLLLPDFEEKYLTLLKSGNLDSYKELSNLFDLNMTNSQLWESSLLTILSKLEVIDQEVSLYYTDKEKPGAVNEGASLSVESVKPFRENTDEKDNSVQNLKNEVNSIPEINADHPVNNSIIMPSLQNYEIKPDNQATKKNSDLPEQAPVKNSASYINTKEASQVTTSDDVMPNYAQNSNKDNIFETNKNVNDAPVIREDDSMEELKKK